jgi:hypothetical protein
MVAAESTFNVAADEAVSSRIWSFTDEPVRSKAAPFTLIVSLRLGEVLPFQISMAIS